MSLKMLYYGKARKLRKLSEKILEIGLLDKKIAILQIFMSQCITQWGYSGSQAGMYVR